MDKRRRSRAGRLCGVIAAVASLALPAAADAQRISGSLIDADTERPIPLGLVMMFTEAGDSITATISDDAGRFTLSSEEPGDFVLHAGALGYEETRAGVFELGAGGAISIEYRLKPAPLEIDRIIVALDRPVIMHHLVQNGFVTRFQRGLGLFVTPHDIENAVGAFTTEAFMEAMPGVQVREVRRQGAGLGVPMPHLGDVVQIQTPAGWCIPQIYVDGMRTPYLPGEGITLDRLISRSDVEAIEVYRRPAEVPVEYSQGTGCGVIVLWSKRGPAAGQRPLTRAATITNEFGFPVLPSVRHTGSPPLPGERIRMEVNSLAADAAGIEAPWEGELVSIQPGSIIVTDPVTARAIAVPRDAIPNIHVQRPRPQIFALYRGMAAGTAATLGIGLGLTLLCDFTDCNRARDDQWGPAIGVGLLVGWAVHRRGPGMRWVSTTLPAAGVGDDGVELRWRLPAR